jgi:ATP-dependent Clp protease protease subunit
MMHQPSGGAQGQATDIEIQAREILSLRQRLNQIYMDNTGQKQSVIEEAVERDRFMSPEEALDFGILDEVVASRPIPDDDDNGDGGDDGTDKKGKNSDGG